MSDIVTRTRYFMTCVGYNTTTESADTLYFGSHDKQPLDYSIVNDATGLFYTGGYYEPRIKDPGNYEVSLYESGRTVGSSRAAVGVITLTDVDGELDYLADYAFDGRTVSVWIGFENLQNDAEITLSPWLTGIIEAVEFSYSKGVASTISFTIRDKKQLFTSKIQTNVYLGTNTGGSSAQVEGTENDIKGKVKPLCYGDVFNIPLVLVNTQRLIYQAHDGPINAVTAVYDRGVQLTLEASVGDQPTIAALNSFSIASGKYATCLAQGFIRLGSSPAGSAGSVTANVQGDATGGYANTVANVCKKLLDRAGMLDYDLAEFAALNSACPQVVGMYLDQETSYTDALDALLSSVNAYGYFSRDGQYHVGKFTAASSADYTYEVDDILSIERQTTADTERGVPVYKCNVNYLKNYTVQSADALAGGADVAHINVVNKEYRTISDTDTDILTAHLLAKDMTRNTLLKSASDAEALAAELLLLYGEPRALYNVTINSGDSIQLNQSVRLVLNRFGMASGKLFRVIGVAEDAIGGKQTLVLWG